MAALLACWGLYLLIVALGALAPPANASGYVQGSALAGLDNAALPLATTALIVGLIALGADAQRLCRCVAATLVAMACVNSAAAVAQLRTGVEFSNWYGGDAGRDSVSVLAAQLGRYSGVVNQPAEAGVLYSLAALCALYVLARRPLLLAAALATIILGGVLTVSKVFLLGGLPLLALALLRQRRGRTARLSVLGATAVGAAAAINAGYLPRWDGLDFLLRLLPGASDQDALTLFSANRYGGDTGGTLAPLVDAVVSGPWAFGYGAAGLLVAYDSAWIEALVVAGVAGVILQASIFVILGRAWLIAPRSAERTLLGYSLVLLVGASFGLPALTANRVAGVAWLLLPALLHAISSHARSGGIDPAGAVGPDRLPEGGVEPHRASTGGHSVGSGGRRSAAGTHRSGSRRKVAGRGGG